MKKHFITYFSLALSLSSSMLISMQEGSAASSNKPVLVNLTSENVASPRAKKADEIITLLNQYKLFRRNAGGQTENDPDVYLSLAKATLSDLEKIEHEHKQK